MEHPLIDDAELLTMEQLQDRISDLNKKLAFAQRTNAGLANQIRMAISTYHTQYQKLQNELWDKTKHKGQDFSDRIDIS